MECTLASIVLGVFCAIIYMYRNRYNKSFVVTLALMPLIVQLVIMLVNGNLGAGVAVMGAFSLVRFRSIPGTAKDIGSIFCAMAVGLATGMGYLAAALVFLVCFSIVNVILNMSKFGERNQGEKQLKITIPENLDYMGIFDDLFEKYTKGYQLTQVRTTNMGSLFELTYTINLKSEQEEKQFIDDIRCRNGNLKIVCGLNPENKEMI
ncbi:DUF4956 domain-containing protein [Emergencia timonensis]|nr:DUF4956 domain-containing protein [Emergencia timonensis]MBS6177916.1 DUF4956 domain-containing protein [Clostridiales bacterium]MCB6476938.1 DUF4956 domain-containing protein [Emergencia timonensis]WNX90711.1 DUF4956 domain-containing protein [Emergencia timonensis]